jgi:hypothetical protein
MGMRLRKIRLTAKKRGFIVVLAEIKSEVSEIKIMNERQRHIFDWLQQVGPELAELYEGSVKMIEDASFSERGRFICHVVRDSNDEFN